MARQTAYTRLRLRQLGLIILFAVAFGPFLNVFTDSYTLGSAIQGVVDGFLIASASAAWIIFGHDGVFRGWFRRVSFLADLVINSVILFTIFMVARAVGNTLTTLDPSRFFLSFMDPHLKVALPAFALVVVGIQFTFQMTRLIGANVLLYFVAGVYHRPSREERVFLFLDLIGSTKLAERLGSESYYELLRRFVDDLTEPVVANQGEIYQYAGDEVVITWRMDRAVRGAQCVRCFFDIAASIEAARSRYESDFGETPRFRGGLHGGGVVGGEIGELKKSIVFVGDILNTAARLEEYAKTSGESLVASGALLDRLEPSSSFRTRFLEEFVPRGKQEPIAAFAVDALSTQVGAVG